METKTEGRSWAVDVDPTWWHEGILGLICPFKTNKFWNIRIAKHFWRVSSSIVPTCWNRETLQKITKYSDTQYKISQRKRFTINHQRDIVSRVVKIDKSYTSISRRLRSSCWMLDCFFSLSSYRTENTVCYSYENKQWANTKLHVRPNVKWLLL